MITREQLEAMGDAELDMLVGEIVFSFWCDEDGWWGEHPSMGKPHKAHASCCLPCRLWGPSIASNGMPLFSSDMSAAWQVVAQIDLLGFNWVIENWMGKTLVRFSSRKPHPKDWSRFTAHTDGCVVARHICIAAVLAAQSAKEST